MDKKIPKKNYIIYSIIVIVTIILVIYASEWYKSYKQIELDNSYISQYINELNYEEFQNYTMENQNTIVYVGKTNCADCITFEKRLYKIIEKNNLKNDIVFLNTTNLDDLKKISDKYNTDNLKINIKVPSIIIIKDGKIVDVLNGFNEKIISDDLINQLLEEHEYIK